MYAPVPGVMTLLSQAGVLAGGSGSPLARISSRIAFSSFSSCSACQFLVVARKEGRWFAQGEASMQTNPAITQQQHNQRQMVVVTTTIAITKLPLAQI
jgi:hypothetical protein